MKHILRDNAHIARIMVIKYCEYIQKEKLKQK